ncbi:MAG: sulfurtransferase-like selenium metabolism protein YedF [Clostridiales bacterium]|nr:sulfurtransferase-like selenium metabolism protein YedF [Clostridiales bacterium]
MDKTIDARELMCPQPLILSKRELAKLDQGCLTVLVDNATAAGNIEAWAISAGLLTETARQGEDYAVTVNKTLAAANNDLNSEGTVMLIADDRLGAGDSQFSQILMRNFIFALTEAEPKPAAMLFMNKGAYFTCEGSPVTESLLLLQQAGVEMLTCGACLDYYGLKERHALGGITNMYAIAEKMLRAAKVIKL